MARILTSTEKKIVGGGECRGVGVKNILIDMVINDTLVAAHVQLSSAYRSLS
jgi:hypothetical protein